jgi:hypothetical protein
VCDPFSGTNRIHVLAEAAGIPWSTGIELEPEWANIEWFNDKAKRRCIIGDSLVQVPKLARRRPRVDAFCTSPGYANRMSDHHDAQERCKACGANGGGFVFRGDDDWEWEPCPKCHGTGTRVYKRNTYTHRLGRKLSENNSGAMQWTGKGGEEYRQLHSDVWALCVQQLREGETFILNIKDHYRKNELQPVTQWHVDTLESLGMSVDHFVHIPCRGNRQGANREKRAEFESIYTFKKD